MRILLATEAFRAQRTSGSVTVPAAWMRARLNTERPRLRQAVSA